MPYLTQLIIPLTWNIWIDLHISTLPFTFKEFKCVLLRLQSLALVKRDSMRVEKPHCEAVTDRKKIDLTD